MNKTEPKQKESYEPPEVRDIAPVSIVARGTSPTGGIPGDPGNDEGGGWPEDNW
jgi:hypothetical protein